MKLYDVLTKKKNIDQVKQDEVYIVPQKKSQKLRHVLFWVAVGFVLVAVYSIGVSFARVRVHIKERRIPFSLQETQFVLVHESKATAGDIPFQIIKITDKAQREVIGTQAPFTTVPTKKTLPIKKTVIKNGKKITVTTAEPSPNKDLQPKTFLYQIADAEKEQVVSTLAADVFERLKRQTRTQIPENLLLYPDLQFFFFNKNNIVFTGNTIAFPVSAEGTLTSYLINGQILKQAIAASVLSNTATYPEVHIPEIGSLEIRAISAAPLDPNTIPDTFTISISGTGTIITKTSKEAIQRKMLGKKTKLFDSILSQIPEADTGTFTMYPFWARNFPTIKSRIMVKVD